VEGGGGVTLPGSIIGAVGQPASIRIGVVTSVSPLRVDVQGTLYRELGYIAPLPSVGDVVALVGQSTSVTSSPSSWLVLGVVLNGE